MYQPERRVPGLKSTFVTYFWLISDDRSNNESTATKCKPSVNCQLRNGFMPPRITSRLWLSLRHRLILRFIIYIYRQHPQLKWPTVASRVQYAPLPRQRHFCWYLLSFVVSSCAAEICHGNKTLVLFIRWRKARTKTVRRHRITNARAGCAAPKGQSALLVKALCSTFKSRWLRIWRRKEKHIMTRREEPAAPAYTRRKEEWATSIRGQRRNGLMTHLKLFI